MRFRFVWTQLAPGSTPLFENIRNGKIINEISENAEGKYHHDNLKESGKLAKEAHVIHRASIYGYRAYTQAKTGPSTTFHSTIILHSTRSLRHSLFTITLIGLHLFVKHLLLLGTPLRRHLRPTPTRRRILR